MYRDQVLDDDETTTRSCSIASEKAQESLKQIDYTLKRAQEMKDEWVSANEDLMYALDKKMN